jgi:hypothetical protein
LDACQGFSTCTVEDGDFISRAKAKNARQVLRFVWRQLEHGIQRQTRRVEPMHASLYPPTTNHQPPTTNHQPVTTNQ